MSKNKKRSAVDTALERRIKKFRSNPFFTTEPIQKYCEIIKEKAYGDCDDCSYINFNDGEQYVPSGVHQLTGEAVVMVNRVSADPFWMQSSAGDIPDVEAFIGEIDDPVTGIPKTRAFWRCKLEETGENHLSELESLYTVAMANHSFDSHNDDVDNTTVNYAVITVFVFNTMFEMDFYEPPSIKIIMEFITDISAALKANPEKRSIDMPKKETFVELIAKLTMMEKSVPLPSASENNGVSENGENDRSHYKKFNKQFKIAIVKRIKENKLSVAQVAKEVGIHSSGLHNWIREYEKYEENAFRGRGRISHKKINTGVPYRNSYSRQLKMAAVKLVKENHQPPSMVAKTLGIDRGNLPQWLIQYEKHGENAFQGSGSISPHPDKRELIDKVFQDVSFETTRPSTDTEKYCALNLTPEKEKELAACSYKLKRYDKEFKISTVKRIKEHQLPVPQVAEKLGIDVSVLNRWIRAHEEDGENAFPGVGPKPHNTPNIDEPVQTESAKTTASGADNSSTADTDAIKKKAAVGSNKKKVKPVYDKQFKIAAVKYVNENKLSAFQVAKELNIPYNRLNRWILEDKKHGENAFPGSGVYHDLNS